jgi:putative transcriptional regulator
MKTQVKMYRKRAKLTQAELARRVHVSSRTIISIEKEQYSPSLMLAYRIAQVFDVDVETLCCLAENKRREDEELGDVTRTKGKDHLTMTQTEKFDRVKQLIHDLYNSTTDSRLQAPLLKAYKRLEAGAASDDLTAHIASAINYTRLTNEIRFTPQQQADWRELRDLGSATILHHDPKDTLLDLNER